MRVSCAASLESCAPIWSASLAFCALNWSVSLAPWAFSWSVELADIGGLVLAELVLPGEHLVDAAGELGDLLLAGLAEIGGLAVLQRGLAGFQRGEALGQGTEIGGDGDGAVLEGGFALVQGIEAGGEVGRGLVVHVIGVAGAEQGR